MIIRLLLIVFVLLFVLYLLRAYFPRLLANPFFRTLSTGVGLMMLRRVLMRSVLPALVRVLGAMRWFR